MQARSYLTGCQNWFIPPYHPYPSDTNYKVVGGGDGTLKNTSGAYPWADVGLLNGDTVQETKDHCYEQIYYATKPSQNNWSLYNTPPVDSRAGWPAGVAWNPSIQNKAGFVCYALVAQGLKEAGYNIVPNDVLSTDWFANNYPVVTGSVQIGDLVLYDFNRNRSYDHVGIITDVSATDQDHYLVVSSIGIVEYFSWGVAEKRLGIFGDSANGGDFTSWKPELEPINKLIVRSQ